MTAVVGDMTVTCGDSATRRALADVELPFVASHAVASARDLLAFVDRSPESKFVLKLISDAVTHKSDLGLVKLGLGVGEVVTEYQNLVAAASQLDLEDFEIIVQPMAPGGVDMFIGCHSDEVFGPVVIVGMGGVTVELFEDVARRLPPINERSAMDMLMGLRSAPLLTGYRGSEPHDLRAFTEVVTKVGEFAIAHRDMLDLDLNPVRILPDGSCLVLDARSTWGAPTTAPESPAHYDTKQLSALFEPNSIAIVGASRDATRPGAKILKSLNEHGYSGAIYPVNASATEVAGLPAYPDLRSLPETPDLVCVAVAAERATATVEECVAFGVPAVIVLASGFGEVGAEGRALETRIATAVRGTRTVVCGPNTIGVVNTEHNMAATFSQGVDGVPLRRGGVSIVAQSGAVAGSLVSRELKRGYGIDVWVTVGNQTDLDVADYIEYLSQRQTTRAIALFLEGVADGPRLRSSLQKAAHRGVPVVAFKTGLTEAGGHAVAAHSGALAGGGDVYLAMLAQEGVVAVDQVTALLEVAGVIGDPRQPSGHSVAIVSTSGGAGSAVADLVSNHGLHLAPVEGSTASRLREILPAFAHCANPLDITAEGAFGAGVIEKTVSTLLSADGVDSVAVVLTSIVGSEAVRVATELVAAAETSERALLVTWLVDHSLAADGLSVLAKAGIRVFDEPSRMISALAQAAHRSTSLSTVD